MKSKRTQAVEQTKKVDLGVCLICHVELSYPYYSEYGLRNETTKELELYIKAMCQECGDWIVERSFINLK